MSTHTPWGSLETAALAYARTLDAAFAASPDEALEEALMAVGELLGGLGCNGFSADLRAHLERVETSIIEDEPRSQYNPGLGGNDPDAYISGRLSDMIDSAREADCLAWLASAQEVMGRLQLAEAA